MATKKKATAKTVQRKGEPLSIRIDPKVRYGLELLSRTQRRSVTGVVEWSIGEAFRNEKTTRFIEVGTGWRQVECTFDDLLASVWAVNELERLIRLSWSAPALRTFDEERMMKVLLNTPVLWNGQAAEDVGPTDFNMKLAMDNWEQLRPVLVEASERPVVKGLTPQDLDRVGLDFPF